MCFSAVAGLRPTEHMSAKAAPEAVNSFHYEQLDSTAKAIYDGIYDMYEADLLKTGTADYDLREGGCLSADACEALAKDSASLTKAMNAARYAFYADYPEVFYVDFPKLNVRVTRDSAGAAHIYLGSGRHASYLLEGFSGASDVEAARIQFDSRVDDIAEGARQFDTQAEQLRYVHNEIAKNASYRLEDTCFEGDDARPGNAPHLGSPYGILVRKQGVCEGYARAFKSVADELGINSILVQGVHQYDSEVAVEHMWNYVELTDGSERSAGSKWYAVDLTQDDPDILVSPENELVDYVQHFDTYGNNGFENEKYFLAGQLTLNGRHFISNTVDAAGGYQFTYPLIEDMDYGMREAVNTMDGFSVTQKDVSVDDMTVTEFRISYKGMNATDARKQGIYILARYYGEDKETGELQPMTGWCYFSESYAFKEDETSVYLQEANVPYMEFAATTVQPRESFPESLTYAGDDMGLIARTGRIYNENQNGYIAPPYILRATPSETATITLTGKPYHIVLEYDKEMVLTQGEELGIAISCQSAIGEDVTGAEYSKVSNISFDGNKTISFDVEFSQMYADNSVIYKFQPTGITGKDSGKVPNPGVYAVMDKTECPSVQSRRGSWELYGKPTIMENQDLSLNGWKTSTGKEVSDKLTHRLSLVATKPSESQEEAMKDVMDSQMPGESDKMLSSTTFNISLVVCNSSFVKTGHKIKLKVGFPEGYGPEDEGVTFKAYHFMRDAQDNVTGVEELDCVVTPYGLIITCDAFSPFTIAAVEKDENEPAAKTAIVTSSEGGSITGADGGMITLSEGAKTIKISADEGYEIESVTVLGETVAITDASTMDISVSYDKMDTNPIVHAEFVAKEVTEKEEQRGEAPVIQTAEPVSITLPEAVTVDKAFDLKAEVEETAGTHAYQWYKDDEKLDGETKSSIHVDTPDKGTHEYKLSVHTIYGTSSADADAVCRVTYSEACTHSDVRTVPEIPSTCTKQGTSSYTVCKACGVVTEGAKESLPLLPHSLVEKAEDRYKVSGADCIKKAVYKKSCSICGRSSDETFEYGEFTDHAFAEVPEKEFLVTAATCTTKAVYKKSCTVCKAVSDETFEHGENIDGHMAVESPEEEYLVSAATCTAKAVYKKSCGGCGIVVGGTFEYGETAPHSPAEAIEDTYKVSDADCQNKAVYKKSCSVCKEALDETFEYGETAGHVPSENADEKYKVSDATCTRKAAYKKSCSVCGEALEETFEYGDVSDAHKLADVVDDKYKLSDATCEKKAVYRKSCSECGRAAGGSFESGELLPHTVTEKVDDKYKVSDATCTKKAVYKTSCSVCGTALEETFEYGELSKEHKLVEKAEDEYKSSDATCEKKAVYKKSCSECGTASEETFEHGELLPHTPEENKDAAYLVSPANCTKKAVYKKSCSVCKTALEETFEYGQVSTEHKETVIKNQKDATCTQVGYTGDTYCKACDKKLKEGKDIKPKGHKVKKVEHLEATHKSEGMETYWLCEDCKKMFRDQSCNRKVEKKDLIIPKIAHTFKDTSDKTHHWKLCSCGEIAEKAEHTFGEWKETIKATKERSGERERVCTVCRFKETETIQPIKEPAATEKPGSTNNTTGTGTGSKPAAPNGEVVKTGENTFLLASVIGLVIASGSCCIYMMSPAGKKLCKKIRDQFTKK